MKIRTFPLCAAMLIAVTLIGKADDKKPAAAPEPASVGNMISVDPQLQSTWLEARVLEAVAQELNNGPSSFDNRLEWSVVSQIASEKEQAVATWRTANKVPADWQYDYNRTAFVKPEPKKADAKPAPPAPEVKK